MPVFLSKEVRLAASKIAKCCKSLLNGLDYCQVSANRGDTVVTQEWFTVGEAAEYLRVSKRTIYKLCQDGLLVGHRISNRGHWRFRKKELDNAMRRSMSGNNANRVGRHK